MAIWNKLRTELDRAGRVAQDALDEGKLRLEIFRARQLVDRAAQALGYAVYRGRVGKDVIDDGAIQRLVDAVRTREEELGVLELRIRDLTGHSQSPGEKTEAHTAPPPSATPPSAAESPDDRAGA